MNVSGAPFYLAALVPATTLIALLGGPFIVNPVAFSFYEFFPIRGISSQETHFILQRLFWAGGGFVWLGSIGLYRRRQHAGHMAMHVEEFSLPIAKVQLSG